MAAGSQSPNPRKISKAMGRGLAKDKETPDPKRHVSFTAVLLEVCFPRLARFFIAISSDRVPPAPRAAPCCRQARRCGGQAPRGQPQVETRSCGVGWNLKIDMSGAHESGRSAARSEPSWVVDLPRPAEPTHIQARVFLLSLRKYQGASSLNACRYLAAQ